ncbi:hypothetical protein SAMN05428978_10333 [Nitrosomonas sp. Nm34]|nr:hypothetical protein SAMN05428978_10333 [Nitrosomonas sp. Nm34]
MGTIQYHEKQGLYKRGPDGKFDVEEVREKIKKYSHPGYNPDSFRELRSENESGLVTDGGVVDFHTSRAMREMYEAKMAALKYGELEGSLLDRKIVEKIFSDVLRGLRDGFPALARNIGLEVAVIDDPKKCEQTILNKINALLIRVADEFRKQI